MYTYIAKEIAKIDNGPGLIKSSRVGVFRIESGREEMVGEYTRNYPVLFRTFYHFRKGERDYALYAPYYGATSVMELPSCKNIGGEEPNKWGFCPVDFYVPCYYEQESAWDTGNTINTIHYRINEPKSEFLLPYTKGNFRSYLVTPLLYYPFGFVAGSLWGDDASWKIQYLDLAEVEKGIIKREEKFGFIEMPKGMTLKQAVKFPDFINDPTDDDIYSVTISIQRKFDLRTGNPKG